MEPTRRDRFRSLLRLDRGIPKVHPTPPGSRGTEPIELLDPDALPAPLPVVAHLATHGAPL